MRGLRIGEKGFTLVELMIVMLIISILAAIAIPQFTAYRQRGLNAAANTDAKNAFAAAQAFFADSGTGQIAGTATLSNYGFRPSEGVNVGLTGSNLDVTTLGITSTHPSSNVTYTVDPNGVITSATN